MKIPRVLQQCFPCLRERRPSPNSPLPSYSSQGRYYLYELDEIPEDLVPLDAPSRSSKQVRFDLPPPDYKPMFPPHPSVRVERKKSRPLPVRRPEPAHRNLIETFYPGGRPDSTTLGSEWTLMATQVLDAKGKQPVHWPLPPKRPDYKRGGHIWDGAVEAHRHARRAGAHAHLFAKF